MKRLAIVLLLILAPTISHAGDFESLAAGILAINIRPDNPTPPSPPAPISDECENCNGTGKLGDGTVFVTCPECDGTGKRKTSEGAIQLASAVLAGSEETEVEELRGRVADLERKLDITAGYVGELGRRCPCRDGSCPCGSKAKAKPSPKASSKPAKRPAVYIPPQRPVVVEEAYSEPVGVYGGDCASGSCGTSGTSFRRRGISGWRR